MTEYTEEELIELLHESDTRDPDEFEVDYIYIIRNFGTWGEFLRQADLDPDEPETDSGEPSLMDF